MRLKKDNTQLSIFNTQCNVAMDALKLISSFCTELEESKGGKGRDSGERGPLFEDREGYEESEGLQAAEPNLQQTAGV